MKTLLTCQYWTVANYYSVCDTLCRVSFAAIYRGCLCQVIPKKNNMLARGTGDSCLSMSSPKTGNADECCSNMFTNILLFYI